MSRSCYTPGLNMTFDLTNHVDDTTKKNTGYFTAQTINHRHANVVLTSLAFTYFRQIQ